MECRDCRWQKACDQVPAREAALQGDGASDEWPPAIDHQQLQQEQERDPMLTQVRQWITEGKRPDWAEVSALDPETKAYYSQWAMLTQRDVLLYRLWQLPEWERDLLQLLVPRKLHSQVLQWVHCSVGAGHLRVSKALHRLRSCFDGAGCRQDVGLHVHCCDACTAQKGPTRHSHAPMQQYQVGDPTECVA